MNSFVPRLEILPPCQRRLWSELRAVPSIFVLYGGTAAALRLAHRQSIDFDFFSSQPFTSETLLARIPFLTGSTLLQSEPNTLTVLLDRDGQVKVSFFGGLTFGRVGEPTRARDIGLAVASMLDLAATKSRVVIERAERKDYVDIASLLKSGIQLTDALGAARALYGELFNPLITLKALSYFGDGDLVSLPNDIKEFLTNESSRVTEIPTIKRLSDSLDDVAPLNEE